jgi:protein-S-isoprenylcysteine O-methyltransferase Ste14
MSLLGLAQLARYLLAGFDQRLGWTGAFPTGVQITALAVCILGNALVVWATAANAFFSQIVRLQPERSQTVATGGPYRFLRHPAYAGSLLFELAVPILLASWAALAVSGLTFLLLVLRTFLEDRALQTDLPGYAEYSHQVRYRLLPGVW